MILDNFISHWNSKHHGSWRDYFIPHPGNNYRPHSLHPKRLAFHAASLVAIKAIVVVFAVFFPLSAWLTPDLALEQSRKIIALTNNLRKSLSLPALQENQRLDQAAYAKSQDMLLGQYFAHTSPSGRGLDNFLKQVNYKYVVAGENLAIGFSSPEEVMTAWRESPTHYANLIDPDFSQIGVSLSEGVFKGEQTTLTAQYFAAPDSAVFALAASAKPSAPSAKPASSEKKSVLVSKKVASPIIDQSKTKISAQIAPDKKEQAVKVETYLATSTKSAEAILGETKVALKQDESDPTKWTGQAVAPQAPIAPASIAATDKTGWTVVSDVGDSNIQPRQVSQLEQYFFFKNNPNKTLALIFNVSSIYFKIILLLAIVSLLLNIFIEIKKQHPHIIASGAGLVCLLVLLIMV